MFDAGLKDAQRKVQAAGLLHPTANASNFEGRGFKARLEHCSTPGEVDREWETTIRPIMELQRAVMRGEGLWQWMNHHPEDIVGMNLGDGARRPLNELPVLDFIGTLPPALADAIVAQALPEDRPRFRNYLRRVFLGVGIITGVSSPNLCSQTKLLNA